MFGQYFKCPPGEFVKLSDIPKLDFISGTIGPCPRPAEICPALTCPRGCNSHGRCIDGACECFLVRVPPFALFSLQRGPLGGKGG